MTDFPDGHLLIREFKTLTEAHSTASRLSEIGSADPDFRLIEVAPTAAGAWVCAFTKKNEPHGCEVVPVNATTMNAFLSLGPKAGEKNSAAGIIEDVSISEIFRSAFEYSRRGYQLLEIRIKRAGPSGAYAIFAMTEVDVQKLSRSTTSGTLTMTVIPLNGDYRRYF